MLLRVEAQQGWWWRGGATRPRCMHSLEAVAPHQYNIKSICQVLCMMLCLTDERRNKCRASLVASALIELDGERGLSDEVGQVVLQGQSSRELLLSSVGQSPRSAHPRVEHEVFCLCGEGFVVELLGDVLGGDYLSYVRHEFGVKRAVRVVV